ncbi:hypothetical protein [Nonomuraea sp. NPDC049400]|uniref:hypothetical protein n=1 Tax=Nonomuraea sp. NPDC049400 TaxID=3364352 RepID=UPI00378D0950
MSAERRCRRPQRRDGPRLDCRLPFGHQGECSPYTLAPHGSWLAGPGTQPLIEPEPLLAEQRQPGESVEEFRRRRRPWEIMASAAAVAVRSRAVLEEAVEELERLLSSSDLTDTSRAQVVIWHEALRTSHAHLQTLDMQSWHEPLRAEITRVVLSQPQ